MRCVSYTRTTSCKEDGKIPADIIKQQDQHIQEYLKKQGWTLSAKYCDRKKDTEENTAFEELTKDGIDRKFDMVVVDSIDRCSRTISCADDVLVKTFVPAGIHFAVVQDEFISIGKTKEELYEYIKKARYEAVQLKGMREYAIREQLEGLYTVHDEKYGYILSDDRRELLIDEEAAVVVREIFQMVLDGMLLTNIVKILNDSEIESPMVHNARVGHKVWPAYDNKWLFCSVRRILRCTAYLETGYYLETILPKLNVRFIAITDDYDSSRKEDRENISVPIKNMVNAMYAKDMSKKILAAKEAQKRNGNITLSKVAFGYVRSEDKTRQVVDETVASVVRMIFQWTLLGVNKREIADRLNLLGVATPGQKEKRKIARVPLEETKWNGGTVRKILENPTYTGDIVTGKLKQSLYKGVKQYHTEPEEWDVQKDMHTPLVARDDYEELQESREEIHKVTKKRQSRYTKDREKYQDSFLGMVRCGECGNVMYFRRYTHNYTTNEKMGSDYYCGNKQCSRNLIEENLLKILVMDQIQILIKSMCDRKLLLQKMKSATKENNIFYKAAAKVRTLERKITQTEERNTRLYEDYVAGIVDKDDFDMMKERYIGELQNLREELQVQEQNQRILEKKANRYMDMVNHMEKYLDKREYNEALVQELVEYIEVYANGSIHVCFKCKDEFQQIAEEMEGVQIG